MQKPTKIALACLVAGVVTVTVLAALIGGAEVTDEPPARRPAEAGTTATRSEETADPTAPPYAVVGTFEGKLAVFRAGHTAPDEVHDVFVASLPVSEQAALAAGIAVPDEVSLQQLLEDYTG